MATTEGLLDSEYDWRRELRELQQEQIVGFLAAVPCVVWICAYAVLIVAGRQQVDIVPLLVALPAGFWAYRLRRVDTHTASWLLVVSLMFTEMLLIVSGVTAMPMAFGIVVIIAAQALLGAPRALLTVAMTWSVAVGAQRFAVPDANWSAGAIDILLLYCATWVATWLASRPVVQSVQWSVTASVQARDALAAVRERRAEILRTLRALEEATYRIERMNRELIIARREAEIARALKARFAATVSHELRGPLNLILGFSRMMALSPEKYGEALPQVYRADVDTIYRSSQHLATLVDDVLDLSQIEAERLPLVRERVSVEDEVVKKATAIMRPLAERKGLIVRLDLAGNLPDLLIDAVRLRQVLLNLLSNAVRFTDSGGVIVRTALEDTSVLVSVRDTGRGIAAADMPRLFEEFRQLDATETRLQSGSGLGLAISKQLVELHGGRMWAESRPGQGSTFNLALPLPGTEPLGIESIGLQPDQESNQAQSICLFVGADAGLLRLLERHLVGYRTIGVPNEQEAVQLVDRLHPRAIVAAPSTARNIYKLLPEAAFDVPVIAWDVAKASEFRRVQNVLGYLVKPIALDALQAIMMQAHCQADSTVLIVDNDPEQVQLLERMLNPAINLLRILKAYDGQQALDLMQEKTPDIVFIDLLMPGIGGEETITRIQANPRTRHIPVVVISAQDWHEGDMLVHSPLVIRHRRPLDVASAARCLQALLAEFHPRYLPDQAADESSSAAPQR